MAIVTGELYKGFTFGDISSKAYGVYITQEAAYDAPERDTEVVEIAGRNGAYILDKGRFKNITVSYKCGIALDDEQSFENAIRTFRNALSAKAGKYVRLEDEYNPNEYRQAAFLGGIEVDMADRRAGEFTVSFDAKPQRFLKSGETAVTIGGAVTNTQTESGSIVSIEGTGADKVTSLVAQIEPVQSGSGDPSPTNVRPITGWTGCNVIVSPTTTASDGTTTTVPLGQTVYGGTVDVVTGVLTVTHKMVDLGTYSWSYRTNSTKPFFTTDISGLPLKSVMRCSIYKQSTLLPNNASMPDYSMSNQAYFATPHNLLIVDSRYTDAASFKTAMNGVQLCYELATPQTYTLTAQEVELLTGNNNVWADTGDITITWGDDPYKVVNPTLFESSPLFSFETTASGSVPININDDTITFTNEPMGRVILASNIDQAIGDGSLTNWESLLVGDRIVIPKVDRIEFHVALPSGYFNRVTNCTGDLSLISSYGVVDNEFAVVCSYNGAIENVYGTRPTTQTKTSTITIEYQTTRGGAYYTTTATISLVVFYNETPNVNEPFFIFSAENSISTGTYNKISISAIYGYSSTQTLDGVVYFDLSIGEAYTINDGAVISINRFVNFGAELPKLKAGANVITYGQGVTDFKLVPKWWEV